MWPQHSPAALGEPAQVAWQQQVSFLRDLTQPSGKINLPVRNTLHKSFCYMCFSLYNCGFASVVKVTKLIFGHLLGCTGCC